MLTFLPTTAAMDEPGNRSLPCTIRVLAFLFLSHFGNIELIRRRKPVHIQVYIGK